MDSYFHKILFAVFVWLLHIKVSVLGFNSPSESSYVKCIERERQALLNFKQSVRDYYGMLSTWREDENNRDCCQWEGIECNNETGHVEMLDLRGSESHYLSGSINITSLVGLPKLEYLDLSSNDGFIGGQIPSSIGSFQSLTYLNLSESFFRGTIPYQLGNLSKLEYLDLKRTGLYGKIPSQLGKLSSLQYLDLSANYDICGEIPSELGSLSHLKYLDLNGNFKIYGTIPSQLGSLSRLRYLDLSYNRLSGALPFQVGNLPLLHTLRLCGYYGLKMKDKNWLSSLFSLTTLSLFSFRYRGFSDTWLQIISEHLPNLRELSLENCALSDDDISPLLPSHSNISTSLSILHLSYNMLTSSTLQLLSNYIPNLQELILSHNNIVLSSTHYLNFSSLVVLDLSHNNLTQTSIFQGNLNFSTKVQELSCANCGLTDKSFLVSSAYIKKSHSLVTLDLSDNLLKSSVVFHWLFNFTVNLQILSLDRNLLEGSISDGLGKVMSSLKYLHLGSNKLKGKIPTSLWFLIQLKLLGLNENYFEGDINELQLTNLSQLATLDLSGNSLSVKFATTWTPPFQLHRLGLASQVGSRLKVS